MVCVFQGFTSFRFGSNSHRVESTSWQRAPFFVKINYLFYFCILIAVSFSSLLPVTSSIHPSPSPLRSLRNCSHHELLHSLLRHRGKLWIEFSQHFLIHRAWYLHPPQNSEGLMKSVCAPLSKGLWTPTEVLFVLVNQTRFGCLALFCFALCGMCFEHIYCGYFHYSSMTIYFNFIEWRQAFLF